MGLKYFTEEELTCKCGCGRQEMDLEFMEEVDELREMLGFPLIVSSAYRCPEYNSEVSTTGFDGPHTTGKAIDISISYEQAFDLLLLAFSSNFSFSGIGINQKGSHRFIHLDTLDQQQYPRPRVWSY